SLKLGLHWASVGQLARFSFRFDFEIFVIQIIQKIACGLGVASGQHRAKAFRNTPEARCQRGNRGSHESVKTNDQQPPLVSSESQELRFKQVGGDVVVERLFLRRHCVFKNLSATRNKRAVEEFLRLTAQSSLNHCLYTAAQL